MLEFDYPRILKKYFNTKEEITSKLNQKSNTDHTHGDITPEGKLDTANAIVVTDNNKKISTVNNISKSKISDFNHTHSKSDISDFTHTHDRNDINDFPTSMTPTSHPHGNISNNGQIGNTQNLPVITGPNGVLQTGLFGNQPNTFCQGNDPRLTDNRHPTSHTSNNMNVYGGATSEFYGHVKLVENLNTNSSDGLALGAGQGKYLKSLIDDCASSIHGHDASEILYTPSRDWGEWSQGAGNVQSALNLIMHFLKTNYIYHLSSSDYNPNVNSNVTLTIKCYDLLGNTVVGNSFLLRLPNGDTVELTTNEQGVTTYTYNCTSSGLISFNVEQYSISLQVSDNTWKSQNCTSYGTLFINPHLRLCEFRYFREGYNVRAANTLYTIHSGAIPVQYRPKVNIIASRSTNHLRGSFDVQGNIIVTSDLTGSQTVSLYATWHY